MTASVSKGDTRCVFEVPLSAFESAASGRKAIFYDGVIVTWVGRPPLQFYEDAIFQPSTFCTAIFTLRRVLVRSKA